MSQSVNGNARVSWKDRRKQQLRDELLATALRLFDEKGLDATSVDEIAARTGVAKGTFYLYFKSKSDLALAVFETGVKEVEGRVAAALAESGEESRSALRGMVSAVLGYFDEHRAMAALLLSGRALADSLLPVEAKDNLRKRYRQATTALCERTIRKGMLQGAYRDDLDPRLAAHALYGMLAGLVYQAVDSGESLAGLGETAISLCEKGIVRHA